MKFNTPVLLRGICLGIGLFFAVGPQEVQAGFFKNADPPEASSNFLETSSHHKSKHGRLSRQKADSDTKKESSAPMIAFKQSPKNKATINRDLVHLVKQVPSTASVDQVIDVTYIAKAKGNLSEVTLTDTIPPNMEYVSSAPKAAVTGKALKWVFPIKEGEEKSIQLKLKAKGTGELGSCAKITAVPEACTKTLIGQPVLTIVKSGPAEPIILGNPVTFSILVKNEGSATAQKIVVTDAIPEGLSHPKGQKQLKFDLDSLKPGATKEFDVTLNTTARGKKCNVVKLESSNADSAKDDACVLIVKPGLKVTKEGPQEKRLGKKASYNILVENVGDIDLADVKVTDTVPPQLQIVEASPGVQIQGNTATWTIPLLAAAAKKNFSIVGKGNQLGKHCNSVTANVESKNLQSSGKACTTWTGLPALLLEVVDTVDPLLIGGKTTYVIKVTNQGTAPDTNIAVTVNFPAQTAQVSSTGDSPVKATSQKSITFAPYAVLKPQQTIEYQVVAKGVKEGDARLQVMLSSDLLKIPVPEVEATQVY